MVTTYYLEMLDKAHHNEKKVDDPKFRVDKVNIPSPTFNKYLYEQVGGRWQWTDRLDWSAQRWLEYVSADNLHTFVAYYDGAPAGYYELEVGPESEVQIAYFGLLLAFIGKGLGGALLSSAISDGWALKASRVWVHTCTLDHPSALSNYQRRGFRIYGEKVKERDV